jgi:hypothetical protein
MKLLCLIMEKYRDSTIEECRLLLSRYKLEIKNLEIENKELKSQLSSRI